MKGQTAKTRVDPKLHVRKKTAGMATGAILGATVAGPVGALIGGAIGTFVGDAAEEGKRLPKQITNRLATKNLRSLAKGKMSGKRTPGRSRKSSASSSAKKKTAAPRPTTKKKSAGRSPAARGLAQRGLLSPRITGARLSVG